MSAQQSDRVAFSQSGCYMSYPTYKKRVSLARVFWMNRNNPYRLSGMGSLPWATAVEVKGGVSVFTGADPLFGGISFPSTAPQNNVTVIPGRHSGMLLAGIHKLSGYRLPPV